MKQLTALFFLLVLPLLAGCGGSDDDNARIAVTPRFVPVRLGLQWPALAASTTGTRLVTAPNTALSVVVSVTDLSKNPAGENDLVAVATINRDPAAGPYTQNFTTSGVAARPNSDTFAELRFYSGLNGTGTQVGFAKKRTTLPANGDLGDFNVATATVTEQN
ncbi:MAG: hypothetical protein H7Y38_05465 [Armatimonadetes bacterium]|nr:hypothetical protein [Armatimonadota bacterium]